MSQTIVSEITSQIISVRPRNVGRTVERDSGWGFLESYARTSMRRVKPRHVIQVEAAIEPAVGVKIEQAMP